MSVQIVHYPIKLLLTIEGGVLRDVHCTEPSMVEVAVVDRDDDALDPVRLTKPWDTDPMNEEQYRSWVGQVEREIQLAEMKEEQDGLE
jgi:hypothetical protein